MKRLFLILVCMMVVQLGMSQKKIKLAVNFLPPNDTVEWVGGGYIVIYACTMTSDTSDPFNGTINIRRRAPVDTSLRVAQVPLSNFVQGDTADFQWYDTIFAIDNVQYFLGDNLMQFWIIPDSGAGYVPDTVTIGFYIKDVLNATDARALARRLALYPNPVNQRLHLDFREEAHKLQAIQVTNLQGQVLQAASSPVKQLDFSGLPAGMYLVDVRYQDGVRGTYRVLHE